MRVSRVTPKGAADTLGLHAAPTGIYSSQMETAASEGRRPRDQGRPGRPFLQGLLTLLPFSFRGGNTLLCISWSPVKGALRVLDLRPRASVRRRRRILSPHAGPAPGSAVLFLP